MLYCFKLIIADDIAIWKRNLGLIGLYNFHLHCIGALELVGGDFRSAIFLSN